MSAAVTPPRYFWRRVFAFLIDTFVSSLLAGLIALVLIAMAPGSFQLSDGMVKTGRCSKVTEFPQPIVDLIDGREVKEARFCKYRPNLIFPAQYSVKIDVLNSESASGRVKHLTKYNFASNEKGTLIAAVKIDEVIGQFVLLLGSAMFLLKGRATPGKRLLKLQITGQGCAICREARRLGPMLLVSVVGTIWAAYSLTLTAAISISWPVAVAASMILLAAFVLYYVVPLIRWKGSMPYDRATGFRVEMKSKNGITP